MQTRGSPHYLGQQKHSPFPPSHSFAASWAPSQAQSLFAFAGANACTALCTFARLLTEPVRPWGLVLGMRAPSNMPSAGTGSTAEQDEDPCVPFGPIEALDDPKLDFLLNTIYTQTDMAP